MKEPCHLAHLATGLTPPTTRSIVYRDECTQCFESQDGPLGIDVCLTCFNGGCLDPAFQHAKAHARKTGHHLALNVRRVKNTLLAASELAQERPLEKLAIPESVEADSFEVVTSITCYAPGFEESAIALEEVPPSLESVARAVLASSSSAQANEVRAWEEQIATCTHVTHLEQEPDPAPVAQASATCHACELSSNLWLCLQCGSLGCGRAQFGGIGGNGHALQHYQSTGHCVNVKLGTITAEGSADLYCYSCDDAVTDASLQSHLARFGIEIARQEKTEKSMTELQVEHNMKFDFSMSGANGQEVVPLSGPGLTGLKNLGNSCYIASVLQVLFSLDPFRKRYYDTFEQHSARCSMSAPAECYDCQMNKIAYGLLSGRYSVPEYAPNACSPWPVDGLEGGCAPSFQEGLKPMMLKAFIGRGHPEFSTMRQQDADEFMRYLFQLIQRQSYHQARQVPIVDPVPSGESYEDWVDPTRPFRFEIEQRLQCTSCRSVRYRLEEQDALSVPVPTLAVGDDSATVASAPNGTTPQYHPVTLEQCLEVFTEPQSVDYTCPRCQVKTVALATSRLASFPRYLVVHARRFAVVNWVPKKLEIPVIINEDLVDLGPYLGNGLQPDEEELPEGPALAVAPEPPVNPETAAALESMGFSPRKCAKAVKETGDSGVEAAMNWLFEHADDPEDESPQAVNHSVDEGDVASLQDMGFTANQAKKALSEAGGHMERAVEWLFSHPDDDGSSILAAANKEDRNHLPELESTNHQAGHPKLGNRSLPAHFRLRAFVSHKGPSVHSGHYIAHVLYPSLGWVFFNDEKVAKADEGSLSAKSLAPFAYIYLFERKED